MPPLFPFVFLLFVFGCGGADEGNDLATDTLATDTASAAADTATSLYDVLRDESRLAQFATAVDSAGLQQTLSGPGPFTVFAPTDSAFRMLDQDLNTLLSPDQPEELRGILLYHISSGEKLEQALQSGTTIRTLEGRDLTITGSGDSLRVGGARILETNLRAGNGVIHVIGQVLQPGSNAEGA